MTNADLFISLWEKESTATRAVLARIPEGSTYRPDPKSRTAREIAWVMVEEERLMVEGVEKLSLEWQEVPVPATMAGVLAAYDAQHDGLTRRLRALPSDRWDAELPFVYEGNVVMRSPVITTAFGFLMDQIHHRGQISTYLRPMGSTVPKIYGPSADET